MLNACDNGREDEIIFLPVANIELVDVGQIHSEFLLEAVSEGNGIYNCRIRTSNIKKNDSIKSLDVLIKGKEMNIEAISSPYDFDCDSSECFTVHDLYFTLSGLKSKRYKITIEINHGISHLPSEIPDDIFLR